MYRIQVISSIIPGELLQPSGLPGGQAWTLGVSCKKQIILESLSTWTLCISTLHNINETESVVSDTYFTLTLTLAVK